MYELAKPSNRVAYETKSLVKERPVRLTDLKYSLLLPQIATYSLYEYQLQINDACGVSDLGTYTDASLKYDSHINKIVGKAYSI